MKIQLNRSDTGVGGGFGPAMSESKLAGQTPHSRQDTDLGHLRGAAEFTVQGPGHVLLKMEIGLTRLEKNKGRARIILIHQAVNHCGHLRRPLWITDQEDLEIAVRKVDRLGIEPQETAQLRGVQDRAKQEIPLDLLVFCSQLQV